MRLRCGPQCLFLGLSKLFCISTCIHPPFCDRAHAGATNATRWSRETTSSVHDLTCRKHPPRKIQYFRPRERTSTLRLAFLPLLKAPILWDPLEGDSCWYKHYKEEDFLPRFHRLHVPAARLAVRRSCATWSHVNNPAHRGLPTNTLCSQPSVGKQNLN